MHSKVLNFLLASHLPIGGRQMSKQSFQPHGIILAQGASNPEATCIAKLIYCETKEADGILLTLRGQITLWLGSYISPEQDRISFLGFIVNISGKNLK